MELIKWFPLLQVSHFTTVLDGIRSYHNTVLRNVEINGQTVTAPPKVALNIYNITKKLKAVFQGYKSSKTDNNPYDALMHDAIQMFSWELNGVFLRTIDDYSEGPHIQLPIFHGRLQK